MDELSTFCTVVKHGSMSRAAMDLHLSQPAVSQRLRALETRYGMQLLRRTNRGLKSLRPVRSLTDTRSA